MGVFQALHAAHQVVLDVERQAGTDAVGVVLVRGQPFGLQKDLVAVLVGKAVDLVFHTGAVARAHAFDLAGEHGAAVKAAADDFVRALVGVRDPARHLLGVHGRMAHEAEHGHGALVHAARHTVTRLFLALAEVNRAAVNARRRAGLQAALGQLQFLETGAERHRRRVPCPASRVIVQAHVDLAIEERPGRQHHGARAEADAHLRHRAHHPVALHHQVIHGLLEQPQVGLVLQHAADGGFVEDAVGLRACGAHGRAFGAVEGAELDATLVRGQRHGTAQRVHLLDQMALANAANAGVAAHLPQGLDVVGEQQGFAAHAGSGQGGLGASMATADNDHIKFLGVQHGRAPGPCGAQSTKHPREVRTASQAEGLGSPSGAIAGNP